MRSAPLARYTLPAEPRTPHCGPTGLWNRRDLVRLVMPLVLGAAGLAIGWYGSAKEADWHDNAGWIVLSVGAVALAGIGLLGWLVAGRLRLRRAQRAVAAALTRRQLRRAGGSTAPAALVTAAGMHRHHRPSCLLMHGKAARPAGAADALTGCGVCGS